MSVVFFSFDCLFLLLCVWCFFSLVAAAFLANKDVYYLSFLLIYTTLGGISETMLCTRLPVCDNGVVEHMASRVIDPITS